MTVGANSGNGEGDDVARRLRALRVDAPTHDAVVFTSRLRARLADAEPSTRMGWRSRLRALVERRHTWAWPLGGVVAGAATFALFALIFDRTPPSRDHALPAPAGPMFVSRGEVPPTFIVPSAKVAVIKLAFSADVDVEDVTFEVSLPEGLCFWSRGKALPERTFRWPGRLAAGENLFPVAVRGEQPGLYRVTARVDVPGEAQAVRHEIWLEVRGKSG